MSASQASALNAIAFQLLAALEAYEGELETLVRVPDDLELYQRVSQRVDEMRRYAAALPMVSVAWVEVLIRHFELTHCLWKRQSRVSELTAVQDCLDRMREPLARLQQMCRRVLTTT
ncbi:MAG: hypothetical protein EOO22_11885 [Comamonadaceae bacterium]|nr:MAG: hypothetical protein EOO22_11885 [Comamonadaceae bacterium]